MLFLWCFFGGVLAVCSLKQEVDHQCDHQQEHECFDAVWRMKEHRANCDRAFELTVCVFDEVLFAEHCEHSIGGRDPADGAGILRMVPAIDWRFVPAIALLSPAGGISLPVV